jgi:hypothetical protein
MVVCIQIVGHRPSFKQDLSAPVFGKLEAQSESQLDILLTGGDKLTRGMVPSVLKSW